MSEGAPAPPSSSEIGESGVAFQAASSYSALQETARQSIDGFREPATTNAYQGHIRRFKRYLASTDQWQERLWSLDGSALTERPEIKEGGRTLRYYDGFLINMRKIDTAVFINFLETLKDGDDDVGDGDGGMSKGIGTLSKARSAAKWLFSQTARKQSHLYSGAGVQLPMDWDELLEEYLKSKKKQQAKEREDGTRKAKEGTDALPQGAMKYLAAFLVASNEPNALFAWCFLLMAWSLCCRMDEANVIRTHALGWADDALTVMFYQSKMDKGGEKTNAFHCYGNVDEPHACILTALASYLSVNQDRHTSEADKANPLIFPGKKTQDNFNNCLKALWKDEAIATAMKELFFLDVSNLSAYMTRKGSTTALTSACSDPPNLLAVHIRAKWTMGVRDRYIQFGAAGEAWR
eukprot:m.35272 g.35272  ORF g.35272 m.35272 type:complete len:407 (+) comp7426_c0_seq1:2055-3275(+)